MKKSHMNSRVIQSAIDTAMSNPEKVLGCVEVTKVIREHMPLIQSDKFGPTIGHQIDEMLADAAKAGDELQSFKLEFEPDRWGQFVASMKLEDETSY